MTLTQGAVPSDGITGNDTPHLRFVRQVPSGLATSAHSVQWEATPVMSLVWSGSASKDPTGRRATRCTQPGSPRHHDHLDRRHRRPARDRLRARRSRAPLRPDPGRTVPRSDRQRPRPGRGRRPADAQKAFATSARQVDGPLVYYSDPECTGRPVSGHLLCRPARHHRPGVVEERLRQVRRRRVRRPAPPGHRPSQRTQRHLYVTDVFCGWDPDLRRAVPLHRRVRDPRLLLQHHVPEERPRRRRSGRGGLDPDQRPVVRLRPRARRHQAATGPSSSTSRSGSASCSARPTTAA